MLYQDPSYSPRERARDLLSRMTAEEKISQLWLVPAVLNGFDEESFLTQYPCGLGATYGTDTLDPTLLDRIQRCQIERTRLGIPLLFMSESLHGFKQNGATVFPQCIGLGATFHPELVGKIADAIGTEVRAFGVRETYAPNLDLSREPRWGRVEENYGEDPYLTSRYAVEYITNLQKHGVAACPKHYAAHGSPEGGVNLSPVHAGERELREVFLPPFAAAFRDAGAMSCMPAYSELDGVPLHANRFLLTDVLRGEFGFEGFTVSDYGAVRMLHTFQHTAENFRQAGVSALRAGIDMEAPKIFGFGDELRTALTSGEMDTETVDQAVERILFIKFKLGLFEHPYSLPEGTALLGRPEAAALARQAAVESAVLLRNEGKLLPLCRGIGKIALIGPSVKHPQVGDYAAPDAGTRAVSLYDGMAALVGEEHLLYARGGGYSSANDAEIAEAVQAAAAADVAVLSLGDNSYFWAGIGWGDDSGADGAPAVTCGEGFDMASLDLPGRQQELLEAVYATGTPVVLLLCTGRPYAVTWAAEHIPAILQIWYPGQEGGHAVASLLFGLENPSGRLPVSFPRSVGHIPCFYNCKASARGYYRKPGTPEKPGRDYVFSTPEALYPFGWGLSYTEFSYSDLTLSASRLKADETLTVSVRVTNTGDRSGMEAVQLYLSDLYCRITPFVKRLRGVQKISLAPGESRTVSFTLGFADFSFINEKMQPEVEPGVFRVCVGTEQAEFEII